MFTGVDLLFFSYVLVRANFHLNFEIKPVSFLIRKKLTPTNYEKNSKKITEKEMSTKLK